LCTVLNLKPDPRFATNSDRVANRSDLRDLLASHIAAWPRDALLEVLANANVPAAPVNTVEDAFADPHVDHRGLRIDHVDVDGTGIPGVAPPIRFTRTQLAPSRPSPRLAKDGSHR
jgi:crotonobetainyl-CoA:carnitine CoA-transferase CaiB-like acyl-CoA transferase